jgi:hypothetical protein
VKLEQIEGETESELTLAAPDSSVENVTNARPANNFAKIEQLAGTIAREESRRKRLVWSIASVCLIIATIIARISALRTNSAESDSLTWLLPIGAAFALVVPIVMAILASYPRRRLRDAMRSLACSASVDQINLLFEAQRSLVGPGTTMEIRRAITRTLPQLRASDARLISDRTWSDMLRVLSAITEPNGRMRSREHVEFYEALIRAMEQIGDERALKPMERIANMRASSQARARLKQAAVECLPALRQRTRAATAPETLLRAAGSNSMEELLRPSEGAVAHDPAILLRAGDNPPAEV